MSAISSSCTNCAKRIRAIWKYYASYCINRVENSIQVTEDLEYITNCEVLIISDGLLRDAIHAKSLDVIKLALCHGIEVICCLELPDIKLYDLTKTAKYYNSMFKYIPRSKNNLIAKRGEYLKNLSVPIIFVGGLLPELDTKEVFLLTIKLFKDSDYKVSALGEAYELNILGYHSYKKYFNDATKNEKEKIIAIGEYINNIIVSEVPDIFIIQIPGGIMRYNEFINNDFTIQAFMLCQVLSPDYFLCCMHSDVVDQTFVDYLNEMVRYKFGFDIDYIHISNVKPDYFYISSMNKFSYTYYNMKYIDEFVIETKENIGIPLYNMHNEIQMKEFRKLIVSEIFSSRGER